MRSVEALMRWLALAMVATLLAGFALEGLGQTVVDPLTLDVRQNLLQCYADPAQIPRNADGSIKRSSSVRYAYQRLVPCPSTGLRTGACPGWERQHVWPLACGGCDAVWNLMWAHVSIKRTGQGEPYCLDCVELKVFCDLSEGRVVQ